MWMALIPLFSSLITALVPDPIKKAEAQAQLDQIAAGLQEALAADQTQNLQAVTNMVSAEAKSGYWIASNWHGLFMLLFGIIIANQMLISPLLGAIGVHIPLLPLPDQLWDLMYISLGGSSLIHSGSAAVQGINKAKLFADLRKSLGPLPQKEVAAIESAVEDASSQEQQK